MSDGGNKDSTMTIWCPLIAPEFREKLQAYIHELPRVNNAYEDWLASIRGKSIIGADMGVVLDRIRMLMINIGVALAQNRGLAEAVQSVVTEQLRRAALKESRKLPHDTPSDRIIRDVVEAFFKEVKFTRDIIPEDEIAKVAKRVLQESVESKVDGGRGTSIGRFKLTRTTDPSPSLDEIVDAAMNQCTIIAKRLYVRLLTPSPWSDL